MRKIPLIALLALVGLPSAGSAAEWVLEQSTITYSVSHPLHHLDGISHAAKGKGVCRANQCEFLIAVPVKSFDSGDSNRDLHMLQVTRAGQFPMITVRTTIPETLSGTTVSADLEIQFAGQTAHYSQVPLQRRDHDKQSRITGTIPLKISDFKIEAPSLLAIPIKNDVPVALDLSWLSR
jgi:polyisoprenoid-binding protein YceI